MNLRHLVAFARTHHGLLRKSAAIELGISRSSWYRGIDSGIFEPLHPNVVRLVGAPPTRHQAILAAVWAAGEGAMASHRPAAFLWGVSRPSDEPIDLILPARSRQATVDGAIAHRPRDRNDLRPVMRAGIPCVNPLRVLVDLGAVDPNGVLAAMEEMLVARVITMRTVHAAIARHAQRGHHGIGAIRAAAEAWALDEQPPDSRLEVAMARLVKQHRLPPVDFHARVCGFEVDFLVTGTTVILECDGRAAHGLDGDQFEFDRVRNARLTAAGYIVVHFTWRQITSGPSEVAGRIRANLRRWAPESLAERPV